ncbi:MAG: siphovirus Gp157 family protein [Pseudomonadota bacterium]
MPDLATVEPTNWQTHLEGLVEDYLEAEAVVAAQKSVIGQAQSEKSAAETEMKDIKAQLREMMNEAGVTNDETDRVKIIMSKGRESVKQDNDFDVQKLPVDYVKLERKPDNTQIKAALARGESIPGLRLERGPDTVSIKLKEQTHG